MRNKNGFSYVEILVALAVFSIALAAALPTLIQSQRNYLLAVSRYNNQRCANNMVHVIKTALRAGESPSQAVAGYIELLADPPGGYGYAVIDLKTSQIIESGADGATGADDASGENDTSGEDDTGLQVSLTLSANNMSVQWGLWVVACLYNADGTLCARASGMVHG